MTILDSPKGAVGQRKSLECIWTAPSVGATAVALKYTPDTKKGEKVDALYDAMPAKHDDFGLKHIEMVLADKK